MRMLYKGHRFPCEIISHTVWLYHRFTLSLRDVEDLMAERGVIVSYETIRCWCLKFGPQYAKSVRRKQGRLGDIWHVDELFVRIQGRQVYLWRAVDQDGDVLDILVTKRRDKRAAKRFFRKVLKKSKANLRGNSSRTSSRPTQRPIAKCSPQSSIKPVSMTTTELKFHTNTPGNKRGR